MVKNKRQQNKGTRPTIEEEMEDYKNEMVKNKRQQQHKVASSSIETEIKGA